MSYNAGLDACSKAGRSDKAMELLGDMQAKGIEPGVVSFNCVIDACARVSTRTCCCCCRGRDEDWYSRYLSRKLMWIIRTLFCSFLALDKMSFSSIESLP